MYFHSHKQIVAQRASSFRYETRFHRWKLPGQLCSPSSKGIPVIGLRDKKGKKELVYEPRVLICFNRGEGIAV